MIEVPLLIITSQMKIMIRTVTNFVIYLPCSHDHFIKRYLNPAFQLEFYLPLIIDIYTVICLNDGFERFSVQEII
jgi:hypothetical protein